MEIDHSSVLPVYYQVKEIIRREIVAGVYPSGSKIPSEHQLQERFGVSRATVRQALADLVVDGLLTKRQGKGTFVSPPKIEDDLLGMSTFKQQMDRQNKQVAVRLLSTGTTVASRRESDLYALADGENVFRVVRLVDVEDAPVFIEFWEIPERHCPGLLDLDLGQLFNKILIGHYRLNLGRVVKYVEPALAGDFEARTLQVAVGSPIMVIERITYPPSGGAALLSCTWRVRGDRCRHIVKVG